MKLCRLAHKCAKCLLCHVSSVCVSPAAFEAPAAAAPVGYMAAQEFAADF